MTLFRMALDPRAEKRRLTEDVYIEPEILEQAGKLFYDAKRKLSLTTSVISSIVVSLCHVAFTRTKGVDTFAVKLTGDGQPILMINPDFLIKIGADQAVFALCHEAYHLLMMHLHTDPHLMKNDNWVTATEACINRRVIEHAKKPLITDADGKVLIVDPKEVYDKYRKGKKELGEDPLSYEDFYKTDLGCFQALEELPRPVKSKNASSCAHASEGAGGGEGGVAPIDESEVEKFMDKVMESAVQEAKNGRPGAKEEILDWMDGSPEAAQKWGDLGAGVLRGETTRTRKTDLWEKWTSDIIGSRLDEGNRLRYNRKVPWDPRVTANGKQPKKYGAVFVDASGSMHSEVLSKIAALIGDIENIDVEWHSFDGEVWPFESGENFRGGGGTSFQIIDDHVVEGGYKKGTEKECCDEDLDFVLVITDGYAPHIMPKEAEKWIWLIVPGGDAWPEAAGMSCRQIDLV